MKMKNESNMKEMKMIESNESVKTERKVMNEIMK